MKLRGVNKGLTRRYTRPSTVSFPPLVPRFGLPAAGELAVLSWRAALMQTILNNIQTWYAAQCDGDWEHSFGIQIATLDNPGWFVKIHLEGTLLEDKAFAQVEKTKTEQSWLICKVEEKKFVGYGDPTRLEEMLRIFLDWAKSEPDWLAVHCESQSPSGD